MGNLRTALDRPLLGYRVLVPLLVVFWFISSIGQTDDVPGPDADWEWLGRIGWVLFGVAFLVTVLFTIAVLVRRVLRRGAPTTTS